MSPLLLLLLALALVCADSAVLAAPVSDTLLVRFRATALSRDALLASPVARRVLARHASVRSVHALLPRRGIARLRLGGSAAAAAILAALQRDPDVVYAERDHTVHALLSPNDPYFADGQQWALPKVSAPAAWDLTTGAGFVAVAILDSGVDPAHPDLASKLLPGYNTFDGSASTDDFYGHGTHVAGIAAAITNNAVGIAGAGFQTRIVPVKVLGDDGSGTYSGVIDGIRWAADRGVKVINMSLGAAEYSAAVQDAVDYAWQRGVVVVAAAGNAGSTAPFYPAALNNVVSVAATGSNDGRAGFSNYGSTVDVAAPGVSIVSTLPTHSSRLGSTYGYLQGTSMASPMVAGQAALLFARSGLSTPPGGIVLAITSTMDAVTDASLPKIPGTNTPGRVNFARAVASLAADNFPDTPASPTELAAQAEDARVALTWNYIASADTYTVKRSLTSGGSYTTLAANLTGAAYTDTDVTNGTTYYYVVTAEHAGEESAPSNEAAATPLPQLLPAPGNLAANALSISTIALRWTDNNSSEGGFEVQRKLGAGGTYATIATVGPNVTSYTASGLSDGMTYFFRVRAYNAVATSPFSNEASATTARAVNAAAFVSQSVPTQMLPGRSYPVTVTLRNTGTTTWTDESLYRLGSQSPQDTTLWGTHRMPLPAGVTSVAPGQTVTFSFTVYGPLPGTYTFQRRMVQDLVEWFGEYTTPVTITVGQITAPARNGTNAAAFVSQSVPTQMLPGRSYPVSITMRNTGTATWTADTLYRLGAQAPSQDSSMWGTHRMQLPAGVTSVAPGQTVTFSFTVYGPLPGSYSFQWRMVQDLVEWFGEYTPRVTVTVTQQ